MTTYREMKYRFQCQHCKAKYIETLDGIRNERKAKL